MSKIPNIVFMGTPDFASKCLETLISNRYKPCGVFCQPDKPSNRGHKLTPPPTKTVALQNNIEVFQPQRLDDAAFETFSKLNPDIVIVVAYGKILPERFLNTPKLGCINLHASLLPKLRGAAPIQWAILNGFKTTGITIMQMDKGMDTGDILAQAEVEINENETSGELFERLSIIGSDFLIKKLPDILNGKISPLKQKSSEATVAPMISKNMSNINWCLPANEINNLIRGLNPWPVAQTFHNNNRLRIHLATPCSKEPFGSCGEILTENNRLYVNCGNNTVLQILKIQKEGSKSMDADVFMHGYPLTSGDLFNTID